MEKLKYAYIITYLNCNYKCSYCNWYMLENNFGKIVEKDNILKLKNFFDERGTWHIEFSGGEVSINPNFIFLCSSLTEKHYISMYTNLSFDVEEFVKKIEPAKVKRISCSLQEVVENNISKFYNKISILKEHGFYVEVTYVATPERLHNIPTYFRDFKKMGVPFIIQPFVVFKNNNKMSHEYTKEDKELLRKYTTSYVTLYNLEYGQQRKSTNKICSAGHSKIYIDGRTGNIYPCPELLSFQIGNAYENELSLFDKKMTCPKRYCNCGIDDRLEKVIEELDEVNRKNCIPLSEVDLDKLRKCFDPLDNYEEYWENAKKDFLIKLFGINDNTIMIYGAGTHTKLLLKDLEELNLMQNIKGIIDSDISKAGMMLNDIRIYSPEDISIMKPNRIIISSASYEDEIYAKLKSLNMDAEIVRLYHNNLKAWSILNYV